MDWGDVFSPVANVIGSVLNYDSAKRNRRSQESMNNANIAANKEFAQNSIQWKVADAKKAGIHPLAALGSQGSYFSPSSVSGGDYGEGQAQAGIVQGLGQMLATALDAINTDAKADLGQQDNNTQFLDIKKDEVNKTAGKTAIAMTENANKAGQPLGAPLASSKMVSLGKGRYFLEPNKDTIDAEALADSEGLSGFAKSYFINQTYRRIAWSEVKRLNESAGYQRYVLGTRMHDNKPEIIDTKEADLDMIEKYYDRPVQKLFNWINKF